MNYWETDPEFTERFEHFAFEEVPNEEGQQLDEVTRHMAILAALLGCQGVTARRLMDLGLGYLSLDRSSSTLSTGERQRMQLARAVRNRTTGVLYVLDEPSIGLTLPI